MYSKQTKTAGLIFLLAMGLVASQLGFISFDPTSVWGFVVAIIALIILLYIWTGNDIHYD